MSIITLSYTLTSAVIGIGMVFVFLCVLLALMMILNRIGEPKPASASGAVKDSADTDDELPEAVIAAAVLALMDDGDACLASVWQSEGDDYSAKRWKERKALESWRRRR